MARIEISSVSNPYGTGELQLQGKVAMSGTLTAVTDNLNNASPLKLSTGGVQVASTLQITTNSNPYIDAEDGAGNNRFTVGRDPSSQVVNVDFASNPTGGTNMVGGIRTYTDGVNLSQVMSFRKDGYIGANTTTPNTNFDVNGQINAGTRLSIAGTSWSGGTNNGGISIYPSNVGGFATATYNFLSGSGFAHCFITNAQNRLFINDAGVGVNSINPTAKLQIVGSGSTSATTSLLVQNSGGSEALKITDDKTITLRGSSVFNSVGLKLNGDFGNVGGISLSGSPPIANTIQGTAGFGILSSTTFNSTSGASMNFGTSEIASTSGSVANFLFGGQPNMQSGNATFSQLYLVPNFTTGGTYSGIARGVYYAPDGSLTGVTSHYAWQNTSGAMIVNSSTPNASAILQADSTTQGFLPPRMTTIQKNAIVSPAIGLMVFDTTLNRPCFYNGIWVTL